MEGAGKRNGAIQGLFTAVVHHGAHLMAGLRDKEILLILTERGEAEAAVVFLFLIYVAAVSLIFKPCGTRQRIQVERRTAPAAVLVMVVVVSVQL